MGFLLPEVMKASQQAIERGVKDCVFIDYKRRSGHFDVTTVASIKEITERVRPDSEDTWHQRFLHISRHVVLFIIIVMFWSSLRHLRY